jgi:hypothetical protein
MSLSIVESSTSMWFYHLSLAPDGPLCGTNEIMMPTRLPVASWGVRTDNVGERYCHDCTIEAERRGLIEKGSCD